MKNLFLITVVLAICAVTTLLQTSIGYCGDSQKNYVPHEILVCFHDWVDEAKKETIRNELKADLVKKIKSIRVEYWKLPDELTTEDALEFLKNLPEVKYAEPNFLYKQQATPNDPFYYHQWALSNQGQEINGSEGTPGADIQASDAWDIFTGTHEIIVAVIDSGCAITHPDLVNAIWINESEANGTPYIDDDNNGYIDDMFGWNFMDDYSGWEVFGDNLHGTHVSGIIAATTNNNEGIAGVCNNAKLMTLRVNNGESFDTGFILPAFEYARLNGAKIINCSFAGPSFSQSFYDEISLLNKSDILVVAAAGNGGTDQIGDDNDITPQYPSSYNLPNIISVAATDNNDNLATFSNYGINSVDIGAPGKDIYSTIPSHDEIFYESMEGIVDDWSTDGTGLWNIEYNSFYNTHEAIFYFHNNNPGFSYVASEFQLINPINLTSKYGNKLIFDARWNLPADAYLLVAGSTNPNDADSWTLLDYFYGPSWVTRATESIPLDNFGFANVPQLYITFAIYYPYFPAGLYWVAVDDIAVTSFANFTYTGNEYCFESGTSMATPVVSGVAALVWSQNPSLTHLQVKDIILNSVDPLNSLNGKVSSGGRVNAYKALLSAIEATNSPPAAPTGLAANAVSSKKIMLRWTDKSDNEDGFTIERKKRGCNSSYEYEEIATVEGDNKYEDTDFEPGAQYSYRVSAYNSSGMSEYSNCGTTTASDSGTPSSPVNLVATYASSSKVNLTWDEWSSKVTKFEIYRQKNSGSWSLLASTDPDTLQYTDTKAAGNQSTNSYSYYVQACNASGCSPPTYKVGMPFQPTGLDATVTGGKIVLTWTDNSTNERGFEIYRKTGNCSSSGSWVKDKSCGINRETVTAKKGYTSGTTYSYRVRAYYRSWGLPYVYGYSNWSNCVSVTTP